MQRAPRESSNRGAPEKAAELAAKISRIAKFRKWWDEHVGRGKPRQPVADTPPQPSAGGSI